MNIYELAATTRIVLYGIAAPSLFVLSLVFWTGRQRTLAVMFLFIVAIVMLQQYGLIMMTGGRVNQDALLVNTVMWAGMTLTATIAAVRAAIGWLRRVCDRCVSDWIDFKIGG